MNSLINWRATLVASDVVAIDQLTRRTGVFSSEESQCASELIVEKLANELTCSYQFLLAELNNRVIAYTCYGRIPFTDQRYDLYWIAVDPAVQRQGVAIQLLTYTEQEIIKLGGKHIYIETSTRDIYQPARNFYAKNAYLPVVTLQDYYRDGDSKFICRKIL